MDYFQNMGGDAIQSRLIHVYIFIHNFNLLTSGKISFMYPSEFDIHRNLTTKRILVNTNNIYISTDICPWTSRRSFTSLLN